MIIPYRPDIGIDRIPWVTVVILVLCFWVHWLNGRDDTRLIQGAQDYCTQDTERLAQYFERLDPGEGRDICTAFMFSLRDSDDPKADLQRYLDELPENVITASAFRRDYLETQILTALTQFAQGQRPTLRTRLAYFTGTWEFPRMLSASVVHFSLDHIIGNVLAFLAFGILVEAIAGPVLFALMMIVASFTVAWGSSLWYQATLGHGVLTGGLSGLVFAVIGALAYLWPGARVRCLIWFFIPLMRFSLPAWLLASFYIGWNVYDLFNDHHAHVNFTAHLVGALTGLLFSAIALVKQRRFVRELVRG